MKLYLILLSTVLITGCAATPYNRTFISEMNHKSDGIFKPGKDFPITVGDSGDPYLSEKELNLRIPASQNTRRRNIHLMSIKSELAEKEKKLTPIQYDRYLSNKQLMPSTSEKIYYLDLPSEHNRIEYLKLKRKSAISNIGPDQKFPETNKFSLSETNIRTSKELYLGMCKDHVISLWGRPNKVSVAGDPKHQNERWTFYENGKANQVYFENGIINGWELY